ncbi:50S ribosomal protein L13 [Helicobacter sp. MIT 14-3879]|uniref:50S ribosomal protein L13 n=1 Tax=Helicobacter sp. MIT 14-3879 TaxID=2040649 RepID=UPI000E1F08DE|nr:50S ribosomal protein L13 [Helicobacter sp. MIT 14-3879]RDU65122.1 50S ribosomal protein L13 [Helicobacter sp. MIT 14-3879]
MNLTTMAKNTNINREWIVLDAKDEVFGRLITKVAIYLRGKHKPSYTPHVDCGDFVVIINANKVKFSGLKLDSKEYFTHSGYFGSTKSKTLAEMLEKSPEKLFRLAVRGMLPKTKLGKAMIRKLKIYNGEEHPHTAQINKSKKD